MRKKKLWIVLLCIVAATALCFASLTAYAEEPAEGAETEETLNLALDQTKWNTTTFEAKADGLYAKGTNVSATTKDKIPASATVTTAISGTLAEKDTTWCYAWIVLKQSDPNATVTCNGKNATLSSGNGLIFSWGASHGSESVNEVIDGQSVKMTDTKFVSGFDSWSQYAVNSEITITMTDGPFGTTLDLVFKGGVTNETKTYSYTCENDFSGEGYYGFGYLGGGTVDETHNYVITKATVEEIAVDNDLSHSAANWTTSTGSIVGGENGITATANGNALLKHKLPANSTVTAKITGTAAGTWGNVWFTLKDTRETPDASSSNATAGSYILYRLGGDFNVGQGTIAEVKDGTLLPLNHSIEGASNADSWYVRKQVTEFTFTTEDTETGVKVTVHVKGENCEYEEVIESDNEVLKGEWTLGIGCFVDLAGGNLVIDNVTVKNNDKSEPEKPEPEEPEPQPEEPEELEPEIANLAVSADNFNGGLGNHSGVFGENGITISQTTFSASLVKDVKAGSKIVLDLEGKGETTGWGEAWIILKDVSYPQVIDARQDEKSSFRSLTRGMNYVAFRFGNSYLAGINEVKDGQFTETIITEWAQSDFTAFFKQRVRVVITTEDSDSGVKFNIEFQNLTTGHTLTKEYVSDNVKLKGDYAVNVGTYVGLNAGESIVIRKFGVTETVEKTDRSGANMATDLKYMRNGFNYKAFRYYDGNGLALEQVTKAGFTMYHKVASAQSVTLKYNNTLTSASYGNTYLLLKANDRYVEVPNPNDREINEYNAKSEADPAAAKGDNWILVMFGADGLQRYVCIDGIIEKTNLGDGADNLDVWYWYKQAPSIMLTATDIAETEEDDAHIEVNFTLMGSSGKLTAKSFNVYEEALMGAKYLQVSYFLSTGGNMESDFDFVCLEKLSYMGLDDVVIPEIDVEALNASIASYKAITAENYEAAKATYEAAAAKRAEMNVLQVDKFNAAALAELNKKLEAYLTDKEAAADVTAKIAAINIAEVNDENYAAAKATVVSARQDYEDLSDAGKAMVTNLDALKAAEAKVKAYEDVKSAADEVIAKIAALEKITVTDDNYETVKADVVAAKAAYEALSEASKARVDNYEIIASAESKINAYEDAKAEESNKPTSEKPNESQNDSTDSGSSGGGLGCGSAVGASGLGLMVLLAAGAVAIFKKKEN